MLAALPEPGRPLILSTAKRRTFERGERLTRHGDDANCLFIIESGCVAVRLSTPDGESVTLSVLGVGAVFGEVGLFSSRGERTATVQALDDVAAIALRQEDFSRLRQTHPEVDDFVMQLMARQVDRLSHLLAEALYLSADRRIARRLYEVGRLYAQDDAPLALPLTQHEVAQIAGTTRPTANQVLKKLEAAGTVRLSRGRIVVADLRGLRAACAWP
jgi:CRP-like cAMP-binding protein